MNYSKILITGATGKLGKALLASDLQKRVCLAPTRLEMDITKKEQVEAYCARHDFDAVIHCAAIASVAVCEKDPVSALQVNLIGTTNLIQAALKRGVRLVYISTDYVYPGVKGPYSEKDLTIPFTHYGWTKLGGECAVNVISNHCIVRTSFFDPDNIPFDTAPSDAFCSKIPLPELAGIIIKLLDSEFTGVINVGQERESLYAILKKYRPDIRPLTLDELSKGLPVKRAVDSSLDITRLKIFLEQH